ncbi:MerR family transcriptional regulator [Sphingomonas naphthae]|uniref:MerR family transcriptional regulator n=1 Tax=Sphingomonas naphthae TaxID=1813468 RepID=A0ABY7TJL8_9SPHN|nr:MerR family transcriptional regulator [Sphingomonas naphthae]WCT73146.1 MerR family transcriptional regulator [Sphingomonas naphthae]
MAEKSEGAFRTIGELSAELGVPQHILRYWETRFPQLKPLQRAGNRRYYRPADVALVQRINRLLNQEGYTVRGVQKLLAGGAAEPATVEAAVPPPAAPLPATADAPTTDRKALAQVRDALARLLADDAPGHL